jgi:hypothetical protein
MSVGRSLKATRDYMLGTVGGAVYGGAIAMLIPHSGEVGLLALLVLAVGPTAFIGAINPSLSAATVTAVIVLLVPAMNHANPLDSTVDRLFEVTVGGLTGLVVSFLVLPSRAVSQIRINAAELLELLAAAFAELLAGLTRGLDNDALHRIQDGIGTALGSLQATGLEAERERATHLSSGPDTGPLLRTIQRLRHDVVMIGRASVVPLPPNVPLGTYQVEARLIGNGVVLTGQRASLEVVKTGFEDNVAAWARQWPFTYGLTTCLMALVFGWIFLKEMPNGTGSSRMAISTSPTPVRTAVIAHPS